MSCSLEASDLMPKLQKMVLLWLISHLEDAIDCGYVKLLVLLDIGAALTWLTMTSC